MAQRRYNSIGSGTHYSLCAVFYVRKTEGTMIVPYTTQVPLSSTGEQNAMDEVSKWYDNLSDVRNGAVYVSRLLVTFTRRS